MIYNTQSVKCILRVTGYFTVTLEKHEMVYVGQNKVKPIWSNRNIQQIQLSEHIFWWFPTHNPYDASWELLVTLK